MSTPVYVFPKDSVHSRGIPSDSFLNAIVNWGKYAADAIFAVNSDPHDIMAQIEPILGPWKDDNHRRAALMEVLRVLGMFESSGNFDEGKDPDNHNPNPESWETGAWQVSYDSRTLGRDLSEMLAEEEIHDAIQFQALMKSDHRLAADYIARLLRHTWKANGPCYKDRHIFKGHLQDPNESIYPWLRKDSMREFQSLISSH